SGEFRDSVSKKEETDIEQRKLNEKVESMKHSIARGDFNEVFNNLTVLSKIGEPILSDELVLLAARYNRLEKQRSQGIISNEEAELRYSKIMGSVLRFLNEFTGKK
ncbi:MAG: hypothetical protein AAF740_04530, partial [Bacteroidota bacterium]